jgi:NOL1/NOP2/fmu family ribosome biogenesis protein
MKILNKKQIKNILNELKEYYGIKELKIDYAFLQNNKDKLYIISKDFDNITTNMRINGLGLYFLNNSRGLRLSIEGSQIVGKNATDHIHKLNNKDIKLWLNGQDLDCKDLYGYYLIKNKKDFYGVGYAKDGRMKNFIPKYRRIKNV